MRTFWPMVRPYRLRLAGSVLLVLLAPLADTAQVWMFKLLVDDVVVPRNFDAFPPIAIAYLGIGGVQGLGLFIDTGWPNGWPNGSPAICGSGYLTICLHCPWTSPIGSDSATPFPVSPAMSTRSRRWSCRG